MNGYLGSDHDPVRPTRRVKSDEGFFPLIRPERHIPSRPLEIEQERKVGAEGGIVSEGVAQVIEDLGNHYLGRHLAWMCFFVGFLRN